MIHTHITKNMTLTLTEGQVWVLFQPSAHPQYAPYLLPSGPPVRHLHSNFQASILYKQRSETTCGKQLSCCVQLALINSSIYMCINSHRSRR
jgi:hypothetical protein